MVYAVYEFKDTDWVLACTSAKEAIQRLKQIPIMDIDGVPLGYFNDGDQSIHLIEAPPQLAGAGQEKDTEQVQLTSRIRQAAEEYILSLS